MQHWTSTAVLTVSTAARNQSGSAKEQPVNCSARRWVRTFNTANVSLASITLHNVRYYNRRLCGTVHLMDVISHVALPNACPQAPLPFLSQFYTADAPATWATLARRISERPACARAFVPCRLSLISSAIAATATAPARALRIHIRRSQPAGPASGRAPHLLRFPERAAVVGGWHSLRHARA